MAATLDVTITFTPSGGSATTYALQVEEFALNIRRSPLHSPMPGANPLQIDMGYFDPNLTIRGILPTTPGSDGTNVICDKNQLEDVVTDHYTNTVTISIPGTSGDETADTTNYVGMISNFSAALRSSKEGIYWTYTLNFLSVKRANG
jgi:hypothetical protein